MQQKNFFFDEIETKIIDVASKAITVHNNEYLPVIYEGNLWDKYIQSKLFL